MRVSLGYTGCFCGKNERYSIGEDDLKMKNKMKYYSIGKFAKIAGVSIATLRYYDKEGVLIPEIRNEQNGYRYYSVRQIREAQVIRDLKPFGVTLEEMKEILQKKDNEYLKKCFLNKIRDIEKEIEILETKSMSIQNAYYRITGCQNMIDTFPEIPYNAGRNNYRVDVAPVKEVWVLHTRYVSSIDVNELFSERCLELQHLRSNYNLYPIGSYIGVFHDGYQKQFSSKEGDLELCLPVIKPDGFECKELRRFGGMVTASTIHIGPYSDLERTYRYLEQWIMENNYQIVGPAMEYYLMDISNAFNEEQYITKIHFPVKRKEE